MQGLPTKGDGFPHEGYPRGWFQLAWSGELSTEAVMPLHYFGRDLVLFRGESGAVSVLDAHCAHLGAHLGYGGRVVRDNIRCPFHGWVWDGGGNNVSIPGRPRPMKCQVGAWDAVESDGFIWVWHDPDGGDRRWAPPSVPEASHPDYLQPWPLAAHCWPEVVVKPQFVTENIVDMLHLQWVHRAASPGVLDSVETDEHRFIARARLGLGVGKGPTTLTPDGPISARVDTVAEGLGATIFRFTDYSDTVYVGTVTPIDDERSSVRLTTIMKRDAAVRNGALTAWARATIREIVQQNDRDFVIFKNWKYAAHPPFVPEEKQAYVKLRQWAAQFYSGDPVVQPVLTQSARVN